MKFKNELLNLKNKIDRLLNEISVETDYRHVITKNGKVILDIFKTTDIPMPERNETAKQFIERMKRLAKGFDSDNSVDRILSKKRKHKKIASDLRKATSLIEAKDPTVAKKISRAIQSQEQKMESNKVSKKSGLATLNTGLLAYALLFLSGTPWKIFKKFYVTLHEKFNDLIDIYTSGGDASDIVEGIITMIVEPFYGLITDALSEGLPFAILFGIGTTMLIYGANEIMFG